MSGPLSTEPGAAGAWAHVLGAVFALVLPAALGFALMFGLAGLLPAPPARSPIPAMLQPWLSMLVVSPVLTWAALLVGIPLAVSAARRGRAGWAAFALGGGALWLAVAAIVGWLLYAAWTSALGPGGEGTSALGGLVDILSDVAVGACAGLSYWLGLRLTAPHLFAPRPERTTRRT